jgi:hypothetical protein
MRLALLLLVGCGRINFDPPGLTGDDVANGDARGNGDGANGDGIIAGSGPQLVDSFTQDVPNGTQVTDTLTNGVQLGDVIIACVGFRDATTNITSVGDNRGNTYAREMQTNRTNNAVSQECMVAVAASSAATVQVTANLSAAANQPSLRVLVYRGVDTSQAIQPQGSGGANIQAMNAMTIAFKTGTKIVGINTADRTATAGSGFTLLFTNAYGDIVEEKTATTTGLQSTPGTLASAGNWVMEAIALPPP